jgi:hypothetical protein
MITVCAYCDRIIDTEAAAPMCNPSCDDLAPSVSFAEAVCQAHQEGDRYAMAILDDYAERHLDAPDCARHFSQGGAARGAADRPS